MTEQAATIREYPGGRVRDIQKVITALSSPVRREILALIWDRELPAGQIAAAFAVTKPTISQHLGVLREAGLATATAVGTSRRYRACQEALRGLHAALGDPGRWTSVGGAPERALSQAVTKPVVVASADVATSQEETFAAFTDPAIYSRWLGVPVTISGGRFAATMEWGTEIRGRYELVHPPELIVMRWDFEDGNVPVPGGEMTGYLRIQPRDRGAHVEVHQLVDTPAQAEFMTGAWTLVLGRLKAGVVSATGSGPAMAARPQRPKRRDPA
jgi:DNA-binding transcriptional ArsR family regulator